jgi:hypothetical protein
MGRKLKSDTGRSNKKHSATLTWNIPPSEATSEATSRIKYLHTLYGNKSSLQVCLRALVIKDSEEADANQPSQKEHD